jgi:hypothetical protein
MESTTTLEPSAAAQLCFNNLVHGACAENLFLPGEDPAVYKLLVNSLFETYRPANDDHASLVSDLAHGRWILWRCMHTKDQHEFRMYDICDSNFWDDGHHHQLDLMDRYTTRASRAYQRARASVRTVLRDAENSNKWRAQLALAQQKIDMAAEKHAAYMTIQQPKIEAARQAERVRVILEEAANRPVPEEENHAPVYTEQNGNRTFIEQQISITHKDGEVTIDEVTPSNDQIRSVIARRKEYPVPPSYVIRCYEFEGRFPDAGYDFLIDDDDNPETRDILDARINHRLTFDQWRSTADQEDSR